MKPVFGQYGGRNEDREQDDWYPSPANATDLLLRHVDVIGPVLDAGAGTGILMRPLVNRGIKTIGVDLHDRNAPADLTIETGVDFLLTHDIGDCVTVIMNPPFNLSDQFVRHALHLVPAGGFVHALLRLTWIAAAKRADLLRHLAHITICGRLSMLPAGRSELDKGHNGTVDFAWFTMAKEPTAGTIVRRA